MTATYIRAYVKRENGWDGNTQTTLSDPFTESKFLSLTSGSLILLSSRQYRRQMAPGTMTEGGPACA